jgi:anti-sigma B factor antagonist
MGPRSQFRTELESNNGVVRVALSGELDIASAPLLEEALDAVIANGFLAVMVDLRELTFIDSSGLRALLRARARADTSGKGLILVGASDAAQRLFELTGTQFLLAEPKAFEYRDRFAGKAPVAPIKRASR